MFFLNVSQIFIESGFSRALIQKIDRTEVDYSTVFVFNLSISVAFYLILFFTSPFIALFYDEQQLVNLIRVLSLTLVINSLTLVQNVKLQINVDFKKIAKINLISVLSSGAVGIVCAYYGYGVWALVVQSLAFSLICFCLYPLFVSWKFSLKFSKESLAQMWRFSSNLLLAGSLAVVTNNIYNLLIGKIFTVKDLGFYHRASSLTIVASDSVTQSIQQVTFPVLSQMQNDENTMISSYKKMMKMSAFIIFPVMALLSVLADPIVKVLLTDEWLPVVPLLQCFAFTRFFYPMDALNLNILNANGRSDLFLKVDVYKLPITIISLIITLPMGIMEVIIGQLIAGVLYSIVNAYMPGRLYGYGFLKQLRDFTPYLCATIALYFSAYFALQISELPLLQLVIGGVAGGVTYLLACFLMKVSALKDIVKVIRDL